MKYNIHDLVNEINKLHSNNTTKELYKAKVEKLNPLTIRLNNMIIDKNITATTWAKSVIKGPSTTVDSLHSHKLNVKPLKIGDTLLVYFNEYDSTVTIIDRLEVL